MITLVKSLFQIFLFKLGFSGAVAHLDFREKVQEKVPAEFKGEFSQTPSAGELNPARDPAGEGKVQAGAGGVKGTTDRLGQAKPESLRLGGDFLQEIFSMLKLNVGSFRS